MTDLQADRPLNTYAVATFTFVERAGGLLTLHNAATGLWGLPGGARQHGEPPDQAALRQVVEQTGLAPTGTPVIVGAGEIRDLYRMDWLNCFYACACPSGVVALTEDHDAFEWTDPHLYRETYFTEPLSRPENAPGVPSNWSVLRKAVDDYLKWRVDHRGTQAK